jgi:N-methylhydantoinase B
MHTLSDPITLQLIRSLLEAAAEDMGITLQRVAFSANIKERRDFSCALFDATGRLLAQAAHIPVHLGSMPASTAAVISHLGVLNDGDVAIVNDPYTGGSHLPDITVVSPIYFKGERIGYAASRAHHADVGGISPGSMALSRHIDDEGHRIPPALLYIAGQVNHAVLDPLLAAVRTPSERLGDLDAQLAANAIGVRETCRLAEHFGIQALTTYSQALIDYSATFMAGAIAQIPDGVYTFEDAMDDDGFSDETIAIRVKITIAGDRAVVDLTGTADAVAGPVNCPRAVACSAVFYCFVCLLDESVPLNEGCFGNIEVITRAGSLVEAAYPSPVVAGNTETSQRVVDAVLGALAAAIPDRIPAASSGSMSSLALGAVAAPMWTYYETIPGGAGGGPIHAGESAVQTHMTNTLNTPAEALEMQYPMRVRRFELARNTGGAGVHPGGHGVIREIQMLTEVSGTILSDRRRLKPWGLAGGGAGSAGQNAILRSDGTEELLRGKDRFHARIGDRVRVVTPGGGGWQALGSGH